MGKTSLLNRGPDLAPKDRAVARINAQGRAGSSPRELVQAMAENLGRLMHRGLAAREDDVFRLPGAAWRNFVADAH